MGKINFGSGKTNLEFTLARRVKSLGRNLIDFDPNQDLDNPLWEPEKSYLVICIKVNPTDLPMKNGSTKRVDNLIIKLATDEGERNDVNFGNLMEESYVGKKFIITNVTAGSHNSHRNSLILLRKDYYNINTSFSGKLPGSPRTNRFELFLSEAEIDQKIDKLSSQVEFNDLARSYNQELADNETISEYNYFDQEINSGKSLYDLAAEIKYNDYINEARKKGTEYFTKVIITQIGVNEDITGDGLYKGSLDEGKTSFKYNWKENIRRIKAREKELEKINKWVDDWRRKGGMTDKEHNEAVEKWNRFNFANHEIVIKYNEIKDKVQTNSEYQPFREKFEQASREVKDGVTAEEELTALPTPEMIDPTDFNAGNNKVRLDRKKKIKEDFVKIIDKGEKIWDCKEAVIKLIEELVKGKKCPGCEKYFSELPVKYKGVSYHNEECKNKAVNEEGDNKYTCTNCEKEFDKTNKPPVEGKCPECKSKENQGNKYTCANCGKEFTDTPAVKEGENYCVNCKDKVGGNDQDQGNDKGQNISQAQTSAIQAINTELNKDPKVLTSELDSDYRNWENQIKWFNKVEDINSLKEQVLRNIKRIRAEKKSAEEIKEKAQDLDNETGDKLKNSLKDLESEEEKKGYEDVKDKVSRNMDRYFQENPDEFKDLAKEIVEKKMTNCKVSESELGAEEKKLYNKLKNKEISDKDQIKQAKEKLIEFIGNKEVDKEIEKLKKEVKANLKSDKQKKEIIKNKLSELLEKDNIYFKKRASEIKNLIKKLESGSSNTTVNPSPGVPWKIILPIAGLVVIIVIVGFWIVKKSRKQQERE